VPAPALTSRPCRTLCSWAPTETSYDGEPLFRCGGCSSEWVPSQAWTPRQADGSLHPQVRAERQRGERGRGWQDGQE
jgi:hypothetical protein